MALIQVRLQHLLHILKELADDEQRGKHLGGGGERSRKVADGVKTESAGFVVFGQILKQQNGEDLNSGISPIMSGMRFHALNSSGTDSIVQQQEAAPVSRM